MTASRWQSDGRVATQREPARGLGHRPPVLPLKNPSPKSTAGLVFPILDLCVPKPVRPEKALGTKRVQALCKGRRPCLHSLATGSERGVGGPNPSDRQKPAPRGLRNNEA